ncbi:thiopeptide-type bacteriocin biosynthesis domain protein [Ostertagia ostertagi]
MQVLDPELGIGYEDLEQSIGTEDFILQLAMKANSNEKDDPINAIKLSLSQNMLMADTIDIESLFPQKVIQPSLLPNTISAMFHIADDLLVIDQLGGITANSLLGRFTHADEAIHAHCRELAQIEANANPDVVFFDIGYQVKDRIDNINRRKSVFSHQLSILDFDTSADPISLSDIYISIDQNTMVLWSKKLNKRLVPRMASAYNYTKSDLPLFRLLCDLQHQGINAYHQFDLHTILPGLAYYPRLQFRNLILSSAKWIIKSTELYGSGQSTGKIASSRAYLRSIGVTGYFKSGFADQTLCFHIDNDRDMECFLRYTEKMSKITIEEVVMGEEPVVRDEKGSPYVAQFIASLVHHEEIYRTPRTISHPKAKNVQRMFAPGSEWIYFEVYCHTQRMNSLLLDYVEPFVVSMKGTIESWFFIRYLTEDGSHLRVRFKMCTADQAPMVIAAFSEMLNEQLTGGIIADLLLRTYKRELERYGQELVSNAEHCFHLDTNLVLTLLRSEPTDQQLYQMSLMVLESLRGSGLLGHDRFERLISDVSKSFTEEHRLGSAEFKELNKCFKAFSKLPNLYLNEEQHLHMGCYCKGLISLLERADEIERSSTTVSMFHMHVNRLFSSHQRTHEMILYYLYLKEFQRGKFA